MARKQTLTLAKVLAAGRKAYKAGTLQAQANPSGNCTYIDDKGCKCVIGAALSPTTLAEIKAKNRNGASVQLLYSWGIVKIAPPELQDLKSLQSLHDRWSAVRSDELQAASRGDANLALEYRGTAEREFLAHLGVKA